MRAAAAVLAFILLPPAPRAAEVRLTWTAPGDDGMSGLAYAYDIRFSLGPITDLYSFMSASPVPVTMTPLPAPPGTRQSTTVTGLGAGTTYWFAIRTTDEAGNWSVHSNVVQRTTPPDSVIVPPPADSCSRSIVLRPVGR